MVLPKRRNFPRSRHQLARRDATDVMLMMATKSGEVSEPFVPGRGASSTMPQKRNPISSELILAAFAKSVLTASAFANARYMLDGAGGSRRADARQSGPHQWPDRGEVVAPAAAPKLGRQHVADVVYEVHAALQSNTPETPPIERCRGCRGMSQNDALGFEPRKIIVF